MINDRELENFDSAVAIIGISGRFPGAQNVEQFWQNIKNGIESITFFPDEKLEASGISPEILKNPNYVKAHGTLKDIEYFDAAFFNINPREAKIMDPQHRLFLECSWEALENAGYNPEIFAGRIGVFAGTNMNMYLLNNLYSNLGSADPMDMLYISQGDKDYLTTRVSYKLNLKGPSVNVNTSCSTSLVAVHLACQSLLNGESDMALAGGVSIRVPQVGGYFYHEGMIQSPDGHCRAFDAQAKGFVDGSAVGVVVLKPMIDALRDGDAITAVIKGSAVNNDGSLKVGYTAPSVEGQSEVIAEALAMAGIEPGFISYIETHGTATTLGDPIEIAGLNRVFGSNAASPRACAIGSVKTNIGHSGAAAGVASLIKTALALQERVIPPSLHFETPNPDFRLDTGCFYVNTTLVEWKSNGFPRRAGVSSFGVGGTNAHVILEEAPGISKSVGQWDSESVRKAPEGKMGLAPLSAKQCSEGTGGLAPLSNRQYQLILLSAKTETALDQMTQNLADHLKNNPGILLTDAAYTLQVGRKTFNHQRMLVCQDMADAAAALQAGDPERVFTHHRDSDETPPLVFMFPGQGAQYVNMALGLYQAEPIFAQQLDRCCELVKPRLGLDLRDVLFPPAERYEKAVQQLTQTWITQPALFIIEYGLARLWMSWGLEPDAMIGHSIGEYVAACLAGVFSLEEALALVVARGKLIQELPPGAMMAVSLPETEVKGMLNQYLSLAAVNGPSLCVVSGTPAAVNQLQQRLTSRGVNCRPLHTSHAFHSHMVDPILGAFTKEVEKIKLNTPGIRYISNVTGDWLKPKEAVDPGYWARQLRQTVRFSDGVRTLLKEPGNLLLEVGPGDVLCTLVRKHPDESTGQSLVTSLRHPGTAAADLAFILNSLGRMWFYHAPVDWQAFNAQEKHQRVPLPTYPFEGQYHWIEPTAARGEVGRASDFQPARPAEKPETAKTPAAPDAEPGSDLERSIATMWQETMRIEKVGLNDDFFELGGDSMIATRIISWIREVYEVEIPFENLFETPTVARLAEVIEELLIKKIQDLPGDEV